MLLQTKTATDYLADRAETWFNTNFEGTLHIGEIRGLLPYRLQANKVVVEHDNRSVITLDALIIRADLIALLRNQISVHEFALYEPALFLERNSRGSFTLMEAFSPLDHVETADSPESSFFHRYGVFAPFVQIHGGSLHFVNQPPGTATSKLPEPFRIEKINAQFFLELTMAQRYLDFSYLTLELPDLENREFSFSGQIFNDNRFLEFNAVRMGFGNSFIDFNNEFDGVNVLSAGVNRQIRLAAWSFEARDFYIDSNELAMLSEMFPDGLSGIKAEIAADGRGQEVNIRKGLLSADNSSVRFDGFLNNFMQPESIAWELNVEELSLDQEQLINLFPDAAAMPMLYTKRIISNGKIEGKSDIIQLDYQIQLSGSDILVDGLLDLKPPYALDFFVTVNNLNLAVFDNWKSPSGNINAEVMASSSAITGNSFELDFNVDLFETELGTFQISDMHIDGNYNNRFVTYEFGYYQGEQFLDGKGTLDLSRKEPHLVARGSSFGLNLNEMAQHDGLPESQWNMNYDINWHGIDPDDWYGRIIMDVFPSIINGTNLNAHQLYLDLNKPGSDNRSLRLTSSMLDFVMDGEFEFSSISRLFSHWQGFFVHRISREYLFDPIRDGSQTQANAGDLFVADIYLELKNQDLLKAYIPGIPDVISSGQLDITIHADSSQLDIRSNWQDPLSVWNGISLKNPELALSAAFRFGYPLHEYQHVDLDLSMDQFAYLDQNLDTLNWSINIKNSSIETRVRIANFGKDVRFETDVSGKLTESDISWRINDLIAGNASYLWMTDGRSCVRYTEDHTIHVDEFQLVSGGDRISINGILSSDLNDSIHYQFVNVDLDRISQMVDGKIGFQGVLNGDFVTKNLADNPVFHGMLTVEGLAFNERIIGDATLASSFNPAFNRFDTELHITADETKYADYIQQNDGIKQDISAVGWLRAPDVNTPIDTLYYFDVDIKELDAWVLRYLMDTIFESIEGQARGSGYLAGNVTDIDFNGEFEIARARVVPVFVETEFLLSGNVSLNRQEGVTLHDLAVRDAANGTGTLSGNFDLNDFQPEKFMDMTLQMRDLRFMDNSDGPEVPFFGSIAGTGVVNISGSNVSPFVRTIGTLVTSSQSRLSIPLVDPAVDEAQGRFIRFVTDFAEADLQRRISTDPAALRQIDRTFIEVFRLDLQFEARPGSLVQLIFDPVTGEIVNARGSGRVRITLEDESLQIFGNYNISDGDYFFVGGDIMTRRFILREGGTIRLDGDPANAHLDITAVYRSRPNIAPLLGAAADQTNRIPVELLLEITGPIDNIENDFYFEFPNAIDATQNAAVLNVLNSEEQKLLQATSLLFTGGFISGAFVGDTQAQELGSTLQARAGQVGISQLLSSQINALLSDNLLNLDVDLNLFGFDQADLGIALRLFDDRLILRREGEVGGQETNIGDLGATYRINPNLSVEVFHRKDPMLMSILGAQMEVENVNGVGLEAQFRFNTWREFGNRVWRNITTLFGLLDNSDDIPEDSDPEEVATGPDSESGQVARTGQASTKELLP